MPAQLSQELVGWLYRVLAPEYLDPNRAYEDVIRTLTEYPSLRPRTDVYTTPDGRPELLLCVYGTIPTVYSGSVYRIPIEFWLPKPYPQVSPIPIIRPTESMMVSPNNYVDQNGMCFHPYLYGWTENHSIFDLIGHLSEAFSKRPPVFARPPEYRHQPQPQHHPPEYHQQPPLPPKPPREQPPQPNQFLMDMETNPTMSRDLSEQSQQQPARPPNPEKLQAIETLEARIRAVVQNQLLPEATQDEQAIQHTEQTLNWMSGQLDSQKTELERLDKACADNETILNDKIAQAQNVITSAKTKQQPDVDEILCAENVVYNQLYDAVAEDHAIEDTMYVLGKALDKDRIKLEPFLKHTRTLAREQFLKKALVNKISAQIGLD